MSSASRACCEPTSARGRNAAAAGAPLYAPSEAALRDAYLAALPRGAPAKRARAFALAMALAPLKAAYEGIVMGEALGWTAGSPFGTAWALALALPRWEALLVADGSSGLAASDGDHGEL